MVLELMLEEELENVHMELILLLNSNPKEVFQLASELDHFNKERQLIEKDVLEKILSSSRIILKILF